MSHSRSAAGRDRRRLAVVFGLSSTVLVVEIAGGVASNSLALLADAALTQVTKLVRQRRHGHVERNGQVANAQLRGEGQGLEDARSRRVGERGEPFGSGVGLRFRQEARQDRTDRLGVEALFVAPVLGQYLSHGSTIVQSPAGVLRLRKTALDGAIAPTKIDRGWLRFARNRTEDAAWKDLRVNVRWPTARRPEPLNAPTPTEAGTAAGRAEAWRRSNPSAS